MAAKRKNPIEGLTSRIKNAAATVDSVMLNRMPVDFQKMQAKRKAKKKETS